MFNLIDSSTLSFELKQKFKLICDVDYESMELKRWCHELILEKPDTYSIILKKRIPSVYKSIVESDGIKFSEKIYNWVNTTTIQQCTIPGCNRPQYWRKRYHQGYSQFCSIACSNRDPQSKAKRLNTYMNCGGIQKKQAADEVNCMNKYGVPHYFQVAEVKQRIRDSFYEKHGVECVMHVPQYAEQVLYSFKTKTFQFENQTVKYKGYENVGLCHIRDNTEFKFGIDYVTGFVEVPKIFYEFDKKHKRYYGDIFIKPLNLSVEIKSEWTFRQELDKNLAKRDATLRCGINHEFWICDKTKLLRFIDATGCNKSIILNKQFKSE